MESIKKIILGFVLSCGIMLVLLFLMVGIELVFNIQISEFMKGVICGTASVSILITYTTN